MWVLPSFQGFDGYTRTHCRCANAEAFNSPPSGSRRSCGGGASRIGRSSAWQLMSGVMPTCQPQTGGRSCLAISKAELRVLFRSVRTAPKGMVFDTGAVWCPWQSAPEGEGVRDGLCQF